MCGQRTYLPMARGSLYLVAIMDWHRRYVVAAQITGSSLTMSASWKHLCSIYKALRDERRR